MRLSMPATNAGAGGVPELAGAGLASLEPLYEPARVAAYLSLDVSTVRRLFADQHGVVKLGRPAARGGKRSYTTMRIPGSVVRRFVEEHSRRVDARQRRAAPPGGGQGAAV
jgi:hypothetical protein